MLCAALPPDFKGLILDCDGAPVATLATHMRLAPDLFAEAACRIGVQPEQCVVFAGSPENPEGARRVGIRTMRVQHTFDRTASVSPQAKLRQTA